MTKSAEHILDTIRHADEILARCGMPTYTERCDQLAHLAEVAVRGNGELEAEIIRLEAEIFKLIGAKPHGRQIATLQATLDDTIELADELLKNA